MTIRRPAAARALLMFVPGLALAWAIVLLTATSATGGATARLDDDSNVFLVGAGELGGTHYVFAQAYFDDEDGAAPVARIRISAPAGYAIDLSAPRGTEVGVITAGVEDVVGTANSFGLASGTLVVADPALFANDPSAQACAPGAHGAVWSASVTVSGQALTLPVFVDQGGDPGAAFTLTACPFSAPSSALPGGFRSGVLSLAAYEVVRSPTQPADYTWNAAVTPAKAGTYEPDAASTFDLRSIVPVPQALSLRTKYDAKSHVATISGTLTAVGKPRANVRIGLSGTSGGRGDFTIDDVRTNADGAFAVHRFIDRTTRFDASVAIDPQPCSAPSSAPGACRNETISPPPSASAIVRVPRATDPKRALRGRDQALARRSVLAASDFPSAWRAYPNDFDECFDFAPDLRSLTITGDATSQLYVDPGGTTGAESTATVFRSRADASKAFAKEAVLGAMKCITESSSGGGSSVTALGTLRFPRVGDATRAFRAVVVDTDGNRFYADLITLRVGRTVIRLQVYAENSSSAGFERSFAGKLVARAHTS